MTARFGFLPLAALACALALSAASCGGPSEPSARVVVADRPPLVLAVPPLLARADLHGALAPLAACLGRELGREVRLRTPRDYGSLRRLLAAGAADLGWCAPRPGDGLQPLCLPRAAGTGSYRGALVARRDGPVRDLADLRGRRVAFVDRESRSGFLCAVPLLEAAGLDPARDLAEVRFAGSHARALALLQAGAVDAAAVSDLVLRPPPADVTVLATSPPIVPDPFVSRPGLDPASRDRAAAALLGLARLPGGPEALSRLARDLNVEGFDPPAR